MLTQFIITALGAVAGAYSAYLLAERRITRRERDDYLALLLVVHEHLEYLQGWLKKYEEQDGTAVFTSPLVMPDIKPEQVQRLMATAFDKDVPRTLIHLLYFWRNAVKGMMFGKAFCLPMETLEQVQKQLEYEMFSLQVQYEQERGNSINFPKLDGGAEDD